MTQTNDSELETEIADTILSLEHKEINAATAISNLLGIKNTAFAAGEKSGIEKGQKILDDHENSGCMGTCIDGLQKDFAKLKNL